MKQLSCKFEKLGQFQPLIYTKQAGGVFTVHYQNAYVKHRSMLTAAYGSGETKEKALANYKQKLRACLLIFNPDESNRKEVWVL